MFRPAFGRMVQHNELSNTSMAGSRGKHDMVWNFLFVAE
jgi:hypothetical protein